MVTAQDAKRVAAEEVSARREMEAAEAEAEAALLARHEAEERYRDARNRAGRLRARHREVSTRLRRLERPYDTGKGK